MSAGGCAQVIALGIRTAAASREAKADDILAKFGATPARAQREARGHPCISLEEVEPDRQQFVVSRSFAQPVPDHEDIAQALATLAAAACEKLRAKGLMASSL